jgi:hypothetical protein
MWLKDVLFAPAVWDLPLETGSLDDRPLNLAVAEAGGIFVYFAYK